MGEIEDVTASRDGGDREALARLIGRYQAPVYNYHLKFLRDPHDAADATQRTFLHMIEGFPRLRDSGKFKNWLWSIAVNEARQTARARMRRVSEGETMKTNPEPSSELSVAVGAAVRELTDEYREPILLRYYQGLDYREIAETLQWPEGTVARRLHDGLERLKKALAAALPAITVAVIESALAGEAKAQTPPSLEKALGELVRTAPARAAVSTIPLWAIQAAIGLIVAVVGGGAYFAVRRFRSPVTQPVTPSSMAGKSNDWTSTDAPVPAPRDAEAGRSARSSEIAIYGIVSDRTAGGPIAGARVELHRISEENRYDLKLADSTTAGPDGVYSFENVPRGRYFVDALAPGYVRNMVEVGFKYNSLNCIGLNRHAESEDKVREDAYQSAYSPILFEGMTPIRRDVSLLRARKMIGRVLNVGGIPIPKARVRLLMQMVPWEEESTGKSGVYSASDEPTETDEAGAYAIESVYPAGECKVKVEADGYAPVKRVVPVEGTSETVRADFVLPPGRAAFGIVTNEVGEPVRDARVSAIGMLRHGKTDAEGRYRLGELRADVDRLLVAAPGCVPVVVPLSSTDQRIPIRKSNFVVRGRVVDERGNPMVGVEVTQSLFQVAYEGRTYHAGFGGGSWERFAEHDEFGVYHDEVILDQEGLYPSTKTAEDGYFNLEGVLVPADGSAQICAQIDGYESEIVNLASPTQDCRIVLKKYK